MPDGKIAILPGNPGKTQKDAGGKDSALTNNRKDRQHHALAAYGNYRNYYFHRATAVPDPRLSLLPPEIFLQKSVLDLGCNAGKLTVEACTHLGASNALGIDLDDVLIGRARDQYATVCSKMSVNTTSCDFSCEDFMNSEYWDAFTMKHGTYDTILLLSITKWLHLHHGDAGLVELFRNLFEVLPLGGTLVVEPQEWLNYKRAVSKNTALRPMYRGLRLRPNFEDPLNCAGFTLSKVIEREEGGFSRPLMIWTKPTAHTGSPYQ